MQTRPVPQQRIIEKMDEYMSRRDYAGAERHLLYWLEEARQGQDLRGELMLRNELIGHYRKTGDRGRALLQISEALRVLESLRFEGSISAGTTYVNAATACNAFGENERALALFGKAREVYEKSADTEPHLLGGLYNNMALTCVSIAKEKQEESAGWYGRAFELYEKALVQMRRAPHGEPEQAITYLNMADALEAQNGPEPAERQISEYLDAAYDLLQTPSISRDGYYAFVCEKCAPAFSYYGYFLAAEELRTQAEMIYQKNSGQENR